MTARAAALGVALGISAAFAGATALVALFDPGAMDAVALYAGARLVASGAGPALLDPAAVLAVEREAAPGRTALLPFVQPPALALLLAPFGLLPFAVAYPAMIAADALILIAACALLMPSAAAHARVLLVLALIAPPSAVALAHAQSSPLILLLVAIAARGGARTGGLALGATLLRPQTAPLLLLAGLLDPGRRAWAVMGALAVAVGSAAIVGIDGLARYAATLVGATAWSVTGELGLRASIGWAAPAIALGAGPAGLVLSAVSALVGAVAVVRAQADARSELAAAWSLVASPHVLLHDAVLALPALMTVAARSPWWAALATAGWVVHLVVVPIGVLVSAALAIAIGAREGRAATGGRDARVVRSR